MPRALGCAVLALVAFLAALISACAQPHVDGHPAPTPILAIPQIPQSGTVIVIHKSQRVLYLYRDGQPERKYPVVLGHEPQGRKRYEGDMRTPEGLYRISHKRLHPRWQYFLSIDYPNADDVRAYRRGVAAGAIPAVEGKVLGIGDNLGIHGNDRPRDQLAGSDWTGGCVAMRNSDVRELYGIVEVGTPVLLLP